MQFLIKSLQADAGVALCTLQASDAADAHAQAQALGLEVLSVAPASLLSRLQSPRGGAKFPLLLFSQELLQLLNSGVSLMEAIETLAEKEARAPVRDVLQGIMTSLRQGKPCLLYTSPSPRDRQKSRMPSSA